MPDTFCEGGDRIPLVGSRAFIKCCGTDSVWWELNAKKADIKENPNLEDSFGADGYVSVPGKNKVEANVEFHAPKSRNLRATPYFFKPGNACLLVIYETELCQDTDRFVLEVRIDENTFDIKEEKGNVMYKVGFKQNGKCYFPGDTIPNTYPAYTAINPTSLPPVMWPAS